MNRLFGLLASHVWRYLDGLSEVPLDPTRDEGETLRLTAAWRALLRMHEPDEDGRCARCKRGQHHGPCTVWQVAIGYFVKR